MNNSVEYTSVLPLCSASRQVALATEDYYSLLAHHDTLEPSEVTTTALHLSQLSYKSICSRLDIVPSFFPSNETINEDTISAVAEVSFELIAETAKRIWDKIIEILTKFKDWILNFFSKANINNAILDKRQEQIRKVVLEVMKENPEEVKQAAIPESDEERVVVIVKRVKRERVVPAQADIKVGVVGSYVSKLFTPEDYSLNTFMRRVYSLKESLSNISGVMAGLAKVVSEYSVDDVIPGPFFIDRVRPIFVKGLDLTKIPASKVDNRFSSREGEWFSVGPTNMFPGLRLAVNLTENFLIRKVDLQELNTYRIERYSDVVPNKLPANFAAHALEPAMIPETAKAIDSILTELQGWHSIGTDIGAGIQQRVKQARRLYAENFRDNPDDARRYANIFVALNTLYSIVTRTHYKAIATTQSFTSDLQNYIADSIRAYY